MGKEEKFVLHGVAHIATQGIANTITQNHDNAGKKRGVIIAIIAGLFLNFLIEQL